MSAEVAIALVGVTVVVLALFTFAAFRYVPLTLAEEDHEVEAGAYTPVDAADPNHGSHTQD